MVYKTLVGIIKTLKRRYQDMKSVIGLQDMVVFFDVEIFSFIGTDPVSSGVCAAGRAPGVFLTP
jgi:hypothetical protein